MASKWERERARAREVGKGDKRREERNEREGDREGYGGNIADRRGGRDRGRGSCGQKEERGG